MNTTVMTWIQIDGDGHQLGACFDSEIGELVDELSRESPRGRVTAQEDAWVHLHGVGRTVTTLVILRTPMRTYRYVSV